MKELYHRRFLGLTLFLLLILTTTTSIFEATRTNNAFAQVNVNDPLINEIGLDEAFPKDESDYRQWYFGCDLEPSIFCDPIASKFKSYSTEGQFSDVVPRITSEQGFVDGKYGQALEMNARYRESIEVMNNPSFNSDRFSISFWVKPSQNLEPYAQILSHANSRNTQGWFIEHLPFPRQEERSSESNTMESFIIFAITEENGTITYLPDIPISRDRFSHIAITFDGSKIMAYRDGVELANMNYDKSYVPDPGLPLKIGSAAYSTSTHRWSGTIDDLVFFTRTLDEEEISSIATNTSPFGNILDDYSDVAAYFPFDGNVQDASGNPNFASQSTLLASMAFTPDGRMLISEKNTGRIMIMKDDRILEQPFAQVSDLYASWEQGMLGITVDPKFSENNFVYVYYTAIDDQTGEVYNKVVRFTDNNSRGENMVVLLDRIPGVAGYHSGGALAFNPADDKLYVTVGDATEHVFAQDPNTYLGKILRINRDGTFPEDNPFENSPVYTIGSRNMYGLAFDDKGYGIMTENGEGAYDEINLVQKGANYGFPTVQPPNSPPELTDPSKALWPLRSYRVTYAPTQAIYYTGDKFPELTGKYIIGTFTGDIFVLSIDKEKNQLMEEFRIDIRPDLITPVIGIAQSPDGDIYFGSYGIYKLESTGYDSRREILFPITISAPSTVELRDLRVNPATNSLAVHLVGDPEEYDIVVRMPNMIIDGVYQIINENGIELDYEVTPRRGTLETEYIDIVIHYIKSDSQASRIEISGARVIPELGTSVFVVLSITFLTVSILSIVVRRNYLGR